MIVTLIVKPEISDILSCPMYATPHIPEAATLEYYNIATNTMEKGYTLVRQEQGVEGTGNGRGTEKEFVG